MQKAIGMMMATVTTSRNLMLTALATKMMGAMVEGQLVWAGETCVLHHG